MTTSRSRSARTLVVGLTVLLGAAAAAAQARPDPRAALFVKRGCTECHAISALQVKASKDVGPDLTFAYGDVVVRYGVNLESFLYDPSGVMRTMLAAHLHLSRADREAMLQTLRALYNEHRADLDDPMRPPGATAAPR